MDVYLHERLAGYLEQEEDGQLSFIYIESYLTSDRAMALSNSLPLRREIFSSKECRGFFSGILPEGEKRRIIARNLGISAQNDFSMLERIGGECAGAITFMPHGQVLPIEEYQYRKLSDAQLAGILKELPGRPLLAGDDGIRLSLAGAQEKLAVHIEEGKISIPFGNAPSTHILKPAIEQYKGIVFNEALCMNLAKKTGLYVANVETQSVTDMDFLLVERYDRITLRSHDKHSKVKYQQQRIHQEDFCQAMGIVPEKKYQSEGGPSIKDCFLLLREVSSFPVMDLQRLLNAVIFNFLIGNHDAHGKNFSLRYDADPVTGEVYVRFAPLYDIVCTIYYPDLSQNMAMAIGYKFKSQRILPVHFEKMAEDTGLSKPLVKKRVIEMAQIILAEIDAVIPNNQVAIEVANLIRTNVKNVITSF